MKSTYPPHPCPTPTRLPALEKLPGSPPVEPVKAPVKAQDEASEKQSAANALGDSMKEVVGSWRTWVLAVTYFFVYLIRQGCTSWLVFYLLEAKGAVDAAAAALTVSGG
jgi:sugar phosphate permease